MRPAPSLLVAERDGIVELSVTRPYPLADASLLALELMSACRLVTQRADPLRAVVLRGQAEGFFVEPPAGPADSDAAAPSWARATDAVANLPLPTLAVLAGTAIGPAWELGLACDLRIARADGIFGTPELRWDRLPAAGGVQRTVRLIGATRALPLLLFARLVTGSEAASLGLVHHVASAQELESSVEALVSALRSSAPIALGYAREAVAAAAQLPLASGLRFEADLAALLLTTADRAEGVSAFLSRRPPSFKGA